MINKALTSKGFDITLALKTLKIGDPAPRFKLESYNAGLIDLDQALGQSKIVLIFSRYFGCPICQLDLKTLLEKVNKITSKVSQLLYVTQSGPDKAKQFIAEKGMNFPVIPSTTEGLYAQYGLGKFGLSDLIKIPSRLNAAKAAGFIHGDYEGTETQNPGQFVIDSEGKIIHAKKGWLDIEEILNVL